MALLLSNNQNKKRTNEIKINEIPTTINEYATFSWIVIVLKFFNLLRTKLLYLENF